MAALQRLRDWLSGQRSSRRGTSCNAPTKRRLTLEALEERALLATIPTLTTLSTSATTVVTGGIAYLTATVAGIPSTSGMPTGTVRFIDETTGVDLDNVTLTNGTATYGYRFLETTAPLGIHEVTAIYSGDADFFASSAQAGAKSTIITAVGQLHSPHDVVSDSTGNLYIANYSTHQVVLVNPTTYTSTVIAGTGTAGYSGDGGLATAATLNEPCGLVLYGTNHLLIAEFGNHCIRQVDLSTGIITTIAGTGLAGYSGDGGLATAAQLNCPYSIAVTSGGSLFIADMANQRIRCVNLTTGIITTVAGTGTAGYSGDGGLATAAELNNPEGVTVDSSGNLYIGDTINYRVRKVVLSTGIITTVAGTGMPGYTGDGGLATAATLAGPAKLTVDSAGNLYIADLLNYCVREIEATTTFISTVAGTGASGYSGNGGLAGSARLSMPGGLTIDSYNNLLICDTGNNAIREVYSVVTLLFHRQYVQLTLTATGGKYTGAGYSATATVKNPSTGKPITGLAITITYYPGTTATGTGATTAPITVGTYTAVASFAGTTIYAAATSAPVTFTITKANPKITVSAITAAYDGNPHAATAKMTGTSGIPADSLEGVTPTFTYYEGVGTGGASSTTAPSAVGTYTVVGAFAGSTDYAAVTSSQIVFKITATTTASVAQRLATTTKTAAKITSTAKITNKSNGAAASTVSVASGRSTTSATALVTSSKSNAAAHDAALQAVLKSTTIASTKVTTSVTIAKTVSSKLVKTKK